MNENATRDSASMNPRLIISIAWIATILSSLQGDTYRLSDPSALQATIANSGSVTVTSDLLLIMAIIFAIPILLCVLTMILKYTIMRWLNRITSIFFGLFHAGYLVSILVFWKSAGYEIVWAAMGLMLSIAVIGYAWKLPKTEI